MGCSILTHTKVTLPHTKVTLPHTRIFFRLKWLKKFLCAVRWLLCVVKWLLCAVKWVLYALMCKKYASMYYYLCVKMINQNFIDCKIKWFFLVSISFFIKKEHNTHYTFYRQYKIDNKSLWWNRILSDSN